MPFNKFNLFQWNKLVLSLIIAKRFTFLGRCLALLLLSTDIERFSVFHMFLTDQVQPRLFCKYFCYELINWLIEWSFVKISSTNHQSQTIRARELKFLEKVHLPHQSHVMCHMSLFTCHMSHIMWHISHVMRNFLCFMFLCFMLWS